MAEQGEIRTEAGKSPVGCQKSDTPADRPKRRYRWLLPAGLLLLLLSGIYFRNSAATRESAAHVPRMTCGQPLREGPPADPWVELTDVRICSKGYVMRRDGMDGNLDQLYVPVYPARLEQEPAPAALTLVLRICDERAKDELVDRQGAVAFTCTIRKGQGQIEEWGRQELSDKYPQIHLRNCWVLTINGLEPTEALARSMMWSGIQTLSAGGLLLIAWAIFAWLARRRQCRRAFPSVAPHVCRDAE